MVRARFVSDTVGWYVYFLFGGLATLVHARYTQVSCYMDMKKSDSNEQQSAEYHILSKLNIEDSLALESKRIALPSGGAVQLDGYDVENKVVCEIYARIGKLKGSQPDKLASDFMKMLLVEKELECEFRKIFCFASEEARGYLDGNTWLGLAARQFDIEVRCFELPEMIRDNILAAQCRQKMVNVKS